MTSSVTSRQSFPVWFSVALPVSWLIGLLSVGFLQLLLDPDAKDSSGEFLDQLSWFVWIGGLVLVPGVAAFVARRHDASWTTTIGLAALSSLIFVVGTILVFAIWVAGYEGSTGMDWN